MIKIYATTYCTPHILGEFQHTVNYIILYQSWPILYVLRILQSVAHISDNNADTEIFQFGC